MKVVLADATHARAWNDFVLGSERGSLYHRFEWRQILTGACRLEPFYFLAESDGAIRGVLPVFLMASRLFGRMMISLPYMNHAGVLAADDQAAVALYEQAARTARETGAKYLELLNLQRLPIEVPTTDFKDVAMLPLDPDPEVVFRKRFYKNVRNRIRKAGKNDLEIRKGTQAVDAFYRIYSENLRDLGTPVLPKRLFNMTAEAFGEDCRFYLALHRGRPVATKFMIRQGRTWYFIWAASRKKYASLSANNLLQWEAIKDACEEKMVYCDLGRSTRGSGPWEFKRHHGVDFHPLYYQYALIDTDAVPDLKPDNPRFALAIKAWKRMPVALTRILGPPIGRLLP